MDVRHKLAVSQHVALNLCRAPSCATDGTNEHWTVIGRACKGQGGIERWRQLVSAINKVYSCMEHMRRESITKSE